MPPSEHARLGGSGAHRWMACPGSVRLEEQAPPEQESEYAAEGTAAHALAEWALREGADTNAEAPVWADATGGMQVFQVVNDYDTYEVVPEMGDNVQPYLDYVRSLPGELYVELQVSLEDLDPPEPMFGTADAVKWDEETGTLEVIDLKYGKGVVVEAAYNPQLLYYALGTVLKLRVRPERIITTIVQPRAYRDEPIESAIYTWDRLVSFKGQLMAAANEAVQPDAPVGPVGEHCKWCRAKAFCPAQQENALAIAQDEFSLDAGGPPPPEALTQDQLLEVLDKAPAVEDWIKSIRAYVKEAIERGEKVPGWKLVAKRATRKWVDEEQAEAWLKQRYKVGEVYKKKLISPYQAEKLLKDKPRLTLPDDFVIAKSSGTNLVPEDHPKPAITSGAEFDTLEDTNE